MYRDIPDEDTAGSVADVDADIDIRWVIRPRLHYGKSRLLHWKDYHLRAF